MSFGRSFARVSDFADGQMGFGHSPGNFPSHSGRNYFGPRAVRYVVLAFPRIVIPTDFTDRRKKSVGISFSLRFSYGLQYTYSGEVQVLCVLRGCICTEITAFHSRLGKFMKIKMKIPMFAQCPK
jgi:hypothetical protein